MKPDRECAVQRKTAEELAAGFDEQLSPVRFGGKTAAISRNFGENAAEFLCNPDCVAEREGFEPSVQVLARTTV